MNGIGDFCLRWDRLAPALAAAGCRVLRYDQFGKGWSRAPTGHRYDADAYDRQLADLVSDLGLAAHPLVLVAHSMGAIVAATFATLRPRQVAALVLLAPAGGVGVAPFPCFRMLQRLVRCASPVLVPLIASLTSGPPPPTDYNGPDAVALTEWDARWIVASRRQNGNRCFAASAARMPLTTLGAHLRALDAPPASSSLRVLILTGADDTTVRGVDAEMWRRAFPRADIQIQPPLPGQHCFFLEYPEATPLVVDFVTQMAS